MVDVRPSRFSEIVFGYDSSETESSRRPELLTRGFVDVGQVIEELVSGDRFIVIGNKGSGKSAIAEHLNLSSTSTRLVNVTRLSEFPYSDLKKIVEGESEERRYPLAWSWLLLLNFLGSFASDEGGNAREDCDLLELTNALEANGLLSSTSLKDLARASRRKRQFILHLPLGVKFESNQEIEDGLRFPFFVERLLSTVLRFRSNTQHLLVLDDLDDVLNAPPGMQLSSLASLITESKRINEAFRRQHIRAKIILLCRTDLFDRLPSSNSNKIRQDDSLRLDWYTPEVDNSLLWCVANVRATMHCGYQVDVANEYLPEVVQGSGKVRVLPKIPASTKEYLLRQTRHTPRDFVMLLKYIQEQTKGVSVRPNDLANGLLQYATCYFRPEVHNELGGYFEDSQISRFLDEFGKMRDGLFRVEQFEAGLPVRLRSMARSFLEVLFDCSAIGNWERGEGQGIRTFRYRFPHCRVNFNEPLVLHPALGLAFNAAYIENVPSGTLVGTGTSQARSGESNDFFQDFQTGKVLKIGGTSGVIQGADHKMYRFGVTDIRNSNQVRLCVGDLVKFQPVFSTVGNPFSEAKDVHLRSNDTTSS